MKILFIWDGAHRFPDQRLIAVARCVKRYSDAELYCISKQPVFFSKDFKVIDWQEAKGGIIQMFGSDISGRLDVGYMAFTDWARFWFLINNPGTLYLDTDIELLDEYPFKDSEKIVIPEGEIGVIYTPENGIGHRLKTVLLQRLQKKPGYKFLNKVGHRIPDGIKTTLTRKYYTYPGLN
jgi:hypothetical protein